MGCIGRFHRQERLGLNRDMAACCGLCDHTRLRLSWKWTSVSPWQSVRRLAEKFLKNQGRHYYVTPTSYLELIGTYKSLLGSKRKARRVLGAGTPPTLIPLLPVILLLRLLLLHLPSLLLLLLLHLPSFSSCSSCSSSSSSSSSSARLYEHAP